MVQWDIYRSERNSDASMRYFRRWNRRSLLTIFWLVLPKRPCANTDTTNTFMKKETSNAMDASMKKYMLASRTFAESRRFTSRDFRMIRMKNSICYFWLRARDEWIFVCTILTFTSAECKNKLCGMMTAPTIPTACSSSSDPQFLHHGMNMPSITSSCGGAETTY